MHGSKTLLAVVAALISACGSSTDPMAPVADATINELGASATATGATYTGSAVAVTTTVSDANNKVCDSGPVPKAGGRVHVNTATASMSNMLAAHGLYCHAGGVNNQGYAEAGLRRLTLKIGGNTIVADLVHAMAGSLCPSNGLPSSRGHTNITGLRVNGKSITMSKAVNRKVNLPNGFILINEQSSFVTQWHAGRTVIALHVVINGSESAGKERESRDERVAADILIGRSQTHIDCP